MWIKEREQNRPRRPSHRGRFPLSTAPGSMDGALQREEQTPTVEESRIVAPYRTGEEKELGSGI